MPTHYEENEAGTLRKRIDNKTDKVLSYLFWCPGCNMQHAFSVDPKQKNTWEFNGDEENPTFKPSLLVKFNFDKKGNQKCHLRLMNGKLQFYEDSTHKLAGKTVELPQVNGD